MTLYLVPRTRAWLSAEEVAAATDCVPAVNDTLDGIRWIRSYVVAEEDGTFSGYCVYEADDPEVLRRHADALMLPTDAVKPVVATIVAAPDPEPAQLSGRSVDPSIELAVGDRLLAGDDRGGIGQGRRRGPQILGEDRGSQGSARFRSTYREIASTDPKFSSVISTSWTPTA